MNPPQLYAGHRILEAMRNAPRYADAVYRMVRSALPPGSSRILDFGAGDGMFAERLLRDGLKVDCVEPDPENQRSLASLGLSPVADIATVDDDHYDFIYTINVLEHLHDLDHHLAELRRVLSANGRLFVFVPAFAILWTSLDDEVAHVRRFTRASLARALASSSLVIEECRYFDSLGFPAALGVRALEAVGAFRYSPQTVGFYDRALLPFSLVADRMLSGVLGKNVVAVARKPTFDCGSRVKSGVEIQL
jgi:SAM-dependent methyltransferase